MKKGIAFILLAGLALLLLTGCAPSANGPGATPVHGGPAGFWKGLWHGFIIVFSFVVSLFKDNVGIYEPYNTGHMYDLGFVLGVMIFFGGGGGGACRRGR